ncbi:MAG TPA: AbrB/MazE/SpoVT family DNA-binding domain-containing protein [Candidatus Deferrimicrobium sp.]|nr:AbrB/MazE/SpoVT family DNA-binding domain-containing protein [Candidatus Deferrimicrobium sp.]
MFKEPKFFGSTTVGDRGQIVLPAELRKEYKIEAGDKLLVIGMPGEDRVGYGHIMLLKAEVLNQFLTLIEVQKSAIKKILDEEENNKSE